jgi:hypothetical protein
MQFNVTDSVGNIYLETGSALRKADSLIVNAGAIRINQPVSFEDVPADKALVVVVENGIFDAAAWAYDDMEFRVFTNVIDPRPKHWLLVDAKIAMFLSGRMSDPRR